MIKKLAALLLVLLLALGATSAVAEGESHLQRVLDSGVLRVAMIPENPGWSVMDAEGNWVGYDVEVAKLLAQELGVELELIPTEGGNRVTMVQTDKCDVVISSFTPTLDRAKVITFSNPYGAAGTLPLCRKDNVFTSWEELSDKKTAYDTAKDNVVSCENALQTLLKTSKLDNLELSKMANEIAKLEAKLEELSGGEKDAEGNVTGGQIVSEVNGVVKEINVTAGNNTDPATAVMTIEVPDRGYTVSMNVTNEQAQKVTIGDTAEISTGYWGSSGLSGKLVGIRNNTSAGQSGGKQLVFDVTGSDITSGTQVSVSIGQRSQNYDTIVPNSALRSDSNGSFVLVIVAKSSPLGNRFVATRVDVTELAKDDVNTAVSGGLSAYDMVLTTATKPVEDGMLVRLPD